MDAVPVSCFHFANGRIPAWKDFVRLFWAHRGAKIIGRATNFVPATLTKIAKVAIPKIACHLLVKDPNYALCMPRKPKETNVP